MTQNLQNHDRYASVDKAISGHTVATRVPLDELADDDLIDVIELDDEDDLNDSWSSMLSAKMKSRENSAHAPRRIRAQAQMQQAPSKMNTAVDTTALCVRESSSGYTHEKLGTIKEAIRQRIGLARSQQTNAVKLIGPNGNGKTDEVGSRQRDGDDPGCYDNEVAGHTSPRVAVRLLTNQRPAVRQVGLMNVLLMCVTVSESDCA